ncbi:hypothetical protein [Stieleria mannarensis]|uniref:hypothetical protein n=1 Tax=Stieleria mannarensis TaxID=2755585 RepID=UPI001600D043|nr:hypothetical protein [Rhodopirellula sp. JC639]
MLQSFTGTFDAGGLRSLEPECDHGNRTIPDASLRKFWAVLESPSPVELRIRTAYHAGDRALALRLISDYAISAGTVLPR